MAICTHFETRRCTSCAFLALAQSGEPLDDVCLSSGRSKEERLRELFAAELNCNDSIILPLQRPVTVFPSRCKAKVCVSGSLDDPVLGLIDADFAGVQLRDCPLHFPLLNRIIGTTAALIPKYRLFPYDIASRRGELKAVLISCNRAQSEAMLRFILRSTEAVPRIRKAIPEIQHAHPELKVVSANIQPLPAAVLEGPQEHVLTAQRLIWEGYGVCRAAFAPQCFVQVTPETAAALYSFAAERVQQLRPGRLLDLYCGVGAFTLSGAPFCGEGTGVELSASAVDCAAAAAQRAGHSHLRFLAADADSGLSGLLSSRPDLVIVNPPRRGVSQLTIRGILESTAQSVIYSSCSPETLVRDIGIMASEFEPVEIAPFDMFPLTNHLETVAVLARRKRR